MKTFDYSNKNVKSKAKQLSGYLSKNGNINTSGSKHAYNQAKQSNRYKDSIT